MSTVTSQTTGRVWLGADSMITALGSSSEAALTAIEAGRIGCREIDEPELWSKPFVAGRIEPEEDADTQAPPEYTLLESRFIRVIGQVVERSGIDAAGSDVGLIIASTKGNIELLGGDGIEDERVFLGEMAQRIGAYCGFRNVPIVISNACISGATALIVAGRLIREGRYRHVVAAGGDTLSRFVVTGFQAFKSVSEQVCRPYDARRDGLTLGEGCGALLLTSERALAAEPCIELAGGAVAGDANHISGPSRTGDGLYFAIRDAMAQAHITAAQVGFVNGHGTGTVYNDQMESKAFALAGLESVPVNGLKPYFGHTMGAAGVVETIVSAHALRVGRVYGTPGYAHTGVPYRLNVSADHRPLKKGEVCVKTASGFGGCNAAIVLRKSDGDGMDTAAAFGPEPVIRQTARVHITSGGLPFDQLVRERFRELGGGDLKFFRMDDLSKLAYVAAGELLRGVELSEKYRAEEVGIVLANRSASLETDVRHAELMELAEAEVSPAVFVYTLPNVSAGEVAIRHKIQGETTFFIQDTPQDTFPREYARMLLGRGFLKAVIYGWCELLEEEFEAEMTLLEIHE